MLRMATLEDHLVLGGMLMGSAIWWTVQASKRYNFARQRQQDFFTSVTYPCCVTWHKYSVEGVVKIFAGVLGILTHVSIGGGAGASDTVKSPYLRSLRFLPVYLTVVISGVSDVLLKFYPRQILTKLCWILLLLTYVLLTILFWDPVGDTEDVFSVLGQLEGVLAALCCLMVILEVKVSHSIGPSLMRSYFTLVLGSWMCHIGFISSYDMREVYNDPTSDTSIFYTPINDLDGHTRVILVTLYFTWHCGIGMLFQLVLWMLTIRLTQQNLCLCPVDEAKETDGILLENRVYLEEVDIIGLSQS